MSVFEILNTRLGSRLDSLKQNGPLYITSPYTTLGTTTLNVNTLSHVLSTGLVCDVSTTSGSVTFPTAQTIQSLLNFDIGNYVNFNICAFSETFPNPNTLSIIGNTDVTVVSPFISTVTSQEIYYATLICISTNPIKFYII